MGRRKRDGNHSPQKKKKLMQVSEANEKYGYSAPDPNKTKTNDNKELSNAHKNTLKEEILQVVTANFMEKIRDMVT
jgi:hypothetical protein